MTLISSKTHKQSHSYNISMSVENITLPPFRDIVILAKKCPQGKIGLSKCFNFLAPGEFEVVELDHSEIEALLINKKLSKRIPLATIINLLEEKVFPYISKGEMIKVDMNIRMQINDIEVT